MKPKCNSYFMKPLNLKILSISWINNNNKSSNFNHKIITIHMFPKEKFMHLSPSIHSQPLLNSLPLHLKLTSISNPQDLLNPPLAIQIS